MRLDGSFVVDHFDHVIPVARNNADLIDVLLPSFESDRQSRWFDDALDALFTLPSLESLQGIDEDIPPLGFVFVFGGFWHAFGDDH